MKKIYTVIFTLFCLTISSQNFKVDNNLLLWQNVYNDSVKPLELENFLKIKGLNIYTENNISTFSYNFSTENLTPYGFKSGSYATYIQMGGFYSGVIEYKNNKYRVTVNKIEVKNAFDPNIVLDISEYVLKQGKIKQNKTHQKVLTLLNNYFTELFRFQKVAKDW